MNYFKQKILAAIFLSFIVAVQINAQDAFFNLDQTTFNEKEFTKKKNKFDKTVSEYKNYDTATSQKELERILYKLYEKNTKDPLNLYLIGKEYVLLSEKSETYSKTERLIKAWNILYESFTLMPNLEMIELKYQNEYLVLSEQIPEYDSYKILKTAIYEFPQNKIVFNCYSEICLKMEKQSELEDLFRKVNKSKDFRNTYEYHQLDNKIKYLSLRNDPLFEEYFANKKRIKELQDEISLILKSRNHRYLSTKRRSLLMKKSNQPVFLKDDINSKIKSYPSYSIVKLDQSKWVGFYFLNDNEVFSHIFNWEKEIVMFPMVTMCNVLYRENTLDHHPQKLHKNKDKISFNSITLELINGELYTLDGTKVIHIDLNLKEKKCLVGNCVNGQGIVYNPSYIYKNKEVPILAQGQWENAELNGLGRIHYLNFNYEIYSSKVGIIGKTEDYGSFYEGDFKDGKYDGFGTFYFRRGGLDELVAKYKNSRVGEFRNGEFIGELEMTSWAKFQLTGQKLLKKFEDTYGDLDAPNDCMINKRTSDKTVRIENQNFIVYEVDCEGFGFWNRSFYYSSIGGRKGFYSYDILVDQFLGYDESSAIKILCNCKE